MEMTASEFRRLVRNCEDVAELKELVLSVNRYMDSETIAGALSCKIGKIPMSDLAPVREAINTAPSESLIADEVLSERGIIYVYGKGFLEWQENGWQKIPELLVKKYADAAYGRFTSSRRINAACNMMKVRGLQKEAYEFWGDRECMTYRK